VKSLYTYSSRWLLVIGGGGGDVQVVFKWLRICLERRLYHLSHFWLVSVIFQYLMRCCHNAPKRAGTWFMQYSLVRNNCIVYIGKLNRINSNFFFSSVHNCILTVKSSFALFLACSREKKMLKI